MKQQHGLLERKLKGEGEQKAKLEVLVSPRFTFLTACSRDQPDLSCDVGL